MFSPSPCQTHDDSPTPSLADIVREETDNGRLIVRFLINLMQGDLETAKPCHRLDAARQLLNLGYSPAQSFIAGHAPAARTAQTSQRRTASSQAADSQSGSFRQDLADLICEETDNGRTAVRFLVDVMQGNLPDFKPHHRLSAARELLRRGFDDPALDSDQEPEDEADYDYDREHDAWRRLHDPDGSYRRGMDGKWYRIFGMSPPHSLCDPSSPCRAETSAAPTSYPDGCTVDEQEYDPFDFETGEEEDCEEEDCEEEDCEEGTCEEEDCQRNCPPAQPATLENYEEPSEDLLEDSSDAQPPERPPPSGLPSGALRISLDSIAVDILNPGLYFSSETLPVPG